MFVAVLSITINFYQEEHMQSTALLPSLNAVDQTIKIENRFDRFNNNYTQLKANARAMDVDIKLILNEKSLKKKEKNKNNFRLWAGILLKYCSSFAYHMVGV